MAGLQGAACCGAMGPAPVLPWEPGRAAGPCRAPSSEVTAGCVLLALNRDLGKQR